MLVTSIGNDSRGYVNTVQHSISANETLELNWASSVIARLNCSKIATAMPFLDDSIRFQRLGTTIAS